MVFKSRDYLIQENMDFIIHTTEQICKRRISIENDDEFSIAIIAFNKACDTYDSDKGNFKAYCQKVIRNALIDFFRKNSLLPSMYDEDSFNVIDYKLSIDDYKRQEEKQNNEEVISDFTKELYKYKIQLSDLVKASPKHQDTRSMLLHLCSKLYLEHEFMECLYTKKYLNVNLICNKYEVKRKLVDKWRKYIIAILIVLSMPKFSCLKNYLNLETVGDNID
ncbi:RNA polymerase sigma factor [Hathewaya proteolytica DSM 3090]|uniref:RNA polymerase sigma factor SigI n=1 Tax=Hathewaya proteolytica DSM 3090 TaxID=1121331 RepID=A0A1M6K787_9CLOT|nr:sigma-70 family RNA polymerase sigma factor [Hathewaya proteolytica]SHJ54805.1 RNA polymerase sigma factor [Hathewaya proteolytica DSM 3090]